MVYSTIRWHYQEIKSSVDWFSPIKLHNPTALSDQTHKTSIQSIQVEGTSLGEVTRKLRCRISFKKSGDWRYRDIAPGAIILFSQKSCGLARDCFVSDAAVHGMMGDGNEYQAKLENHWVSRIKKNQFCQIIVTTPRLLVAALVWPHKILRRYRSHYIRVNGNGKCRWEWKITEGL